MREVINLLDCKVWLPSCTSNTAKEYCAQLDLNGFNQDISKNLLEEQVVTLSWATEIRRNRHCIKTKRKST